MVTKLLLLTSLESIPILRYNLPKECLTSRHNLGDLALLIKLGVQDDLPSLAFPEYHP